MWAVQDSGTPVDFHLSGAMSNKAIAPAASPTNPVNLTRGDLFNLMPYENSLVVLKLNGPQVKSILERGFRNWYYYTYFEDYGGYSHYTTCMLTTDAGNKITYYDPYPALPDGTNVVSMVANGKAIDFNDANTYYNVSSVNYLVAGSCNFNDAGVTLWPLNQIVADTQYYVRNSVTNYMDAFKEQGPIAPAIEGRLQWVHPGACPTTQPYGIGYWKNHATKKATDCVTGTLPLRLGNLTGTKSVNVTTAAQAVSILKMGETSSNGISKLYAQLLAAKLNVANGVDNAKVAAVIFDIDTFLGAHNASDWSKLTKAEKIQVQQWITLLDNFNNGL